jgi:hypothetical protein
MLWDHTHAARGFKANAQLQALDPNIKKCNEHALRNQNTVQVLFSALSVFSASASGSIHFSSSSLSEMNELLPHPAAALA